MPRSLRVPRARRLGLLAVCSLAFAFAWPMQGGGLPDAHYLLVKALATGTAAIDDVLTEVPTVTNDKSVFEGRVYSNKAPALAVVALPTYLVLREAGARTVGDPTRMLWALGLVGVVLPAVALVLLVRRVADRFEPGFGIASAVVLGAATIVLPFATVFLSHVLAALLVFAAFAVLLAERDGAPRLTLVGAAGLLAGLAVVVEYPNVIGAAVLGLYALVRAPRLARAAAYAGGAVVGVLPLLGYSLWAYGSITHTTYDIDEDGSASSLVGAPKLDILVQLFLSKQGLLVITPVLACALWGTVLVARRGFRAEALVIVATTVAYAVFSSAYYAPFGGYSPVPRYLVPVMPFLAVALGPAFRAAPVTTGALALVSGALMAMLTATHPLTGYDGLWLDRLGDGDVPITAASLAGITGWYAILPFFAALVLAGWFAFRASPQVALRPLETALAGAAVLVWAVVAASSNDGGPGQPTPYGTAAALAAAAVALALAVRRAPRRWVRGRTALQ